MDPKKTHSRFRQWKDTTVAEVKIFFCYVFMMSIIKLADLHKYWSRDPLTRIPFFTQYMTRNRFLILLSMMHFNDDRYWRRVESKKDNKDKLYKLRPLVNTFGRTFLQYTPEREIALDEGGCPFSGRLGFRQYNPKKPNKYSIKTYQVSESRTGYTLVMQVYTGKDSDKEDKDGNATAKIVMNALEQGNLLDQGYHVYMDNYYNSVVLAEQLSDRKTYCCGTLNCGRKGVPPSIAFAKSKKGLKKKLHKNECIWRRSGNVLLLVWMDKKPVSVISTIHCAWFRFSKKNYQGREVFKPEPIAKYNKYMFGVDLADQLCTYYTLRRKHLKWWRKLAYHWINVAMVNIYILCRKYINPKLKHVDFVEHLIRDLLSESVPYVTLPVQITPKSMSRNVRFEGQHLPTFHKATDPSKNQSPSRNCVFCKFSDSMHRRSSRIYCFKCKASLHVPKCWEGYHRLKVLSRDNVKKFLNGTIDEKMLVPKQSGEYQNLGVEPLPDLPETSDYDSQSQSESQ